MGGGLAFLSKKFFNPANLNNQRRVWEAEQRAEKEAKAAKERAEQLKRERDDEELAKARGGKTGGDRAALSFMYAVPPGMADEKKRGGHGDGDEDAFGLSGSEDDRKPAAAAAGVIANASGDITQRQPGDDDAAAAFRAMLQRPSDDADHDASQSTGPSNALVGSEYDPSAADQKPSASSGGVSGDNRTQLEKAVGRRDAYNTSLTLEEQVARFPSLKNAPMAPGMKADNVNVSFKPLGAEIRNVKCLKCGVWGHSKGDRECKLSGWNPFELGSELVPGTSTALAQGAASAAAAAAAAAAESDTQDRATDDIVRTSERKKSKSSRKRAYSSESSSSSSDTDSSEEERRRRRRKKKERRKRSKKSIQSHHKSWRRDRDDHDDRRHSRKKRKHSRERERSRRRRYDDDYSSDDSASYSSYGDRRRRKRDGGGRETSRRRSRSRSRPRSRS